MLGSHRGSMEKVGGNTHTRGRLRHIFSYNSYHGVSRRYSDDNLVAHNAIVGNGAHGVFIIRDSTGNRIINNTFSGNSQKETYDWDSIYSFTADSQGLDEG